MAEFCLWRKTGKERQRDGEMERPWERENKEKEDKETGMSFLVSLSSFSLSLIYSATTAGIVSCIPVVDRVNPTGFNHRGAGSD